jgi:hypothetical protein
MLNVIFNEKLFQKRPQILLLTQVTRFLCYVQKFKEKPSFFLRQCVKINRNSKIILVY